MDLDVVWSFLGGEAYWGRWRTRRLVEEMIDRGPGAGFRWLLHTADAHGLYARFGFAAPDATLLERPGARSTLAP